MIASSYRLYSEGVRQRNGRLDGDAQRLWFLVLVLVMELSSQSEVEFSLRLGVLMKADFQLDITVGIYQYTQPAILEDHNQYTQLSCPVLWDLLLRAEQRADSGTFNHYRSSNTCLHICLIYSITASL